MSPASRVTVEVSRRFEASPESVFDAWLDPTGVGKWLFATPAGEMVRIHIDARVGGEFAIVERREGLETSHEGKYLEFDRPRRIVFEFSVPLYSQEKTQVTVAFAAQGSGCELTLSHEGVLPEWAERTQQGWAGIIAKLAETLG